MRVLILSPHTDDAELGCGGTIVKFKEEGHEIFWIVFSTASESLPKNLPSDTLKREYLGVIHQIGLNESNCKIFDFKVRYLHTKRQEILEDLISVRSTFSPDLVIGPSINDFHQDHQVVAGEMIRAFKTTSSIISYELPWNHITFNTELFIRLNKEEITEKCSLLKNYKSQITKGRAYFSEEYLLGLAKVRGVQCNTDYAEAFEVIRWMI